MAERLYPNLTVIIEIAVFLMALWLLGRYLFKPFLRVLEERKKRIEGSREDAVRLKEELKTLLETYQSKIREAKAQSEQVIEKLKKEGEEVNRELVEKAKLESEKYFNESKKKIWDEAMELQKKLNATAIEVSDELTSKILQ